MIPAKFLFIPIILQILIVGFDECYYHNLRPIVRGEQLGHALDTFTVLVCYVVVLFLPPTSGAILLFTLLSVASCVFITKDELLYHQDCVPAENFVHALAFLLHPVVFVAVGLLWPALHGTHPASAFTYLIHYHGNEFYLVSGMALLLLLFALYELVPRERIWGTWIPVFKQTRWAVR